MATVTLKLETATTILRYVNNIAEYPASFGEGDKALKLSTAMRAKFKDGLRHLKKALWTEREFRSKSLLYAGPKSLYKEVESTKTEIEKGYDEIRYEPNEKGSTIDVNITGSAEQGVCALLLIWLRADNRGVPVQLPNGVTYFTCKQLSIGEADEIAYPLIEQLKLNAWVRKWTELDAAEAFEITHDVDKDEAKDEKAEEAAT